MIFFTADTHFCHANVIKFTNRPFKNTYEMDQEIIKRWNSVVSPTDRIYILGDFIWRGGKGFKAKIIGQLNGEKILILGNHDGKTSQPKSYLNMGFKEVYAHNTTITIEGYKLLLCHFPYNPNFTKWQLLTYKLKHFWKIWCRDKYPLLKHLDKLPIDNGNWLLHGHIHNRWKIRNKMINVGVDVWDYYPVSEQQILKILKNEENPNV